MSDQPVQQSPSPSEFGFSIFSRRSLLTAAAALGAGTVVAACGDDDEKKSDTSVAPEDVGSVTIGINEADGKPKDGFAAALGTTGLEIDANYVDHNSFQENFNTYLQDPDDVMTWFAGYRMRFFAAQGLVGDISDVWEGLEGYTDGFKTASTGDDGKQYFLPFTYYPWAVHYRKSLFEEKGYTVPTNKDELIALATKMQEDGIIPFAYANDGKWPVQGTFDILNMRINGYQFHVDLLAGKESWTDDRVKALFQVWADLLPFHQENPNGRKWEEAATALENKEAGMYYLGTFVSSNSTDEAYLDDLDFFNFPELDPAIGAGALDAPIDGFMMAANPKNADGAKALLAALGTAGAVNASMAVNPSSVPANSGADSAAFTKIQAKSAELVSAADNIAQFLDRDTSPDFVNNVIADAFAAFHTDPSSIDTILADIEARKGEFLS